MVKMDECYFNYLESIFLTMNGLINDLWSFITLILKFT